MNQPGEFDLIARFFAPLTLGAPGAFNLCDDAAILPSRPGHELVVTTDTLVSGIHFFGGLEPGLIAAKCLRVNLSDLAAMGAEPTYYTLSLGLPKEPKEDDCDEKWLHAFAEMLGDEQKLFGITLIGGDTVSTPGPLMISISAYGWVKTDQFMKRNGACPGDKVFVSGTIGDAALGLKGELSGDVDAYLSERLHLPTPRVTAGLNLKHLASAALDISDGLVQDLGHICRQSGASARICADDIPLSTSAQKLLSGNPHLRQTILTGGDDYELLFTVPYSRTGEIISISIELDLPMTQIGEIIEAVSQPDVVVCDCNGEQVHLNETGWQHFR